MSLLTFLMSVCLVSLFCCVDNYVDFYVFYHCLRFYCLCVVCHCRLVLIIMLNLVSLFTFLMFVCPESLSSCVNNYVDFYVLCHCLRF